jgi:hypothetical protein
LENAHMDLCKNNISLKKLQMRIYILVIIFIFANCNKINQEIPLTTKNTNELKWLLTGLPNDHSKENFVAKLYGFQFEDVGGCVVSEKLRDSINLINRKTNDSLRKKFGKYWRINFEAWVKYVERKTTL